MRYPSRLETAPPKAQALQGGGGEGPAAGSAAPPRATNAARMPPKAIPAMIGPWTIALSHSPHPPATPAAKYQTEARFPAVVPATSRRTLQREQICTRPKSSATPGRNAAASGNMAASPTERARRRRARSARRRRWSRRPEATGAGAGRRRGRPSPRTIQAAAWKERVQPKRPRPATTGKARQTCTSRPNGAFS